METVENKGVVYEFGKFVLDPREKTLVVDGIPMHLPAKEFDTLLLLVENNGRALSKEEMLSSIWHDSIVEESNLAKQISRLRKLLNSNGEEYIETLPKHGYRFSADLRRSIIETDEAVVLERRTVRRVTFAVENEIEPKQPSLPPAKPNYVRFAPLALLLLVAMIGTGYLVWLNRQDIFSTPLDPYAPVRLTDNPNDDTGPNWTKDGRIRFSRLYPDNRAESWVMNADGSGQSPVGMPQGKRIFSWSPDEQKMLYQKEGDTSKTYLSNADGSGEILLPFRSGNWSADSKMIVHHAKVAATNYDIFVYWVENAENRNITNHEAFDADPSFSPDGSKVAFASGRDGNAELYSINVDGSNLRRLTFDPKIDSHPAYSPDGTQLLFNSDRENENGDVYLMSADGSNPVKVTNWDKSNETAGPGSWSPDGTKIAFFSDRDGKDDLYVISAETVRPRLVFSDPYHDVRSFSHSPDGKKIAYSQELDDKSGELRILDLDTRQPRLVTKTELASISPDWSPNDLIAFHDRVAGNSEVCVVKPDGRGLQNLTNDPSTDTAPSWSPDGKYISFITTRGEPMQVPQLYLMNSDGSETGPVTSRKGWEGEPVWSPDGHRIVFVCDRDDSPGNLLDVCEINPDGTGEKRLLFHRDHDGHPVVSPDGNRIAFVGRGDGNSEIYLMNRDGSGLLRLTRDRSEDQWPEWSPDGKKLMFLSNRSGRFGIYEVVVP